MTWIVGTTSVFGHAILAADVCVTFAVPNGQRTYLDCLQKIHPLGRFVVGGFAGSVRTGFAIIETLSKRFNEIPETHAVDLESMVPVTLSQIVKGIFESSPPSERIMGCQIIIGWVHPTRNRDGWPWPSPWSYIYTLSSPDFQVVQDRPLDIIAIGSGTTVAEHMRNARNACSASPVMTWERGGRMGAAILAVTLGAELESRPVPGVSTFFQIGVAARGERIGIVHHDKGPTRFPIVARTYREFELMCRDLGIAGEGAAAS